MFSPYDRNLSEDQDYYQPTIQQQPYSLPPEFVSASTQIPGPYEIDPQRDFTGIEAMPVLLPEDPPPLLSNNPVTANIVLFKELSAYPNYGNPSRNADILYTGNTGTWTFESPAFLFVPGNLRAQIRIRAVLDDHTSVPANRYSAKITINGVVVHNGRVPLDHGAPAGGMFTNWRELPFTIRNMRRVTRVTIDNTSTAGPDDWIGLDWMEIRYLPR